MIDMKLPGCIGERTATSTIAALEQFKGQPIRLWINSEGGDASSAIKMFEVLQHHRPLTTIVHGRADSAASIVFLAGFPRVIEERSTIMVHDPIPADAGSKGCDEVREWLIGCYVARTGLSRAKITGMMRRETRLNADEAVRLGFAHKIARSAPRTDNFQRLTVPGALCS